jgi:hypothetical protein
MTTPWTLASGPIDPGFGPWRPLDPALATAPDAPGIYLVRSGHLAAHHWPAGGASGRPWLEPGLIYVGISLHLRRRLQQFDQAAEAGAAGHHPGGYWFHHHTRALPLYDAVRERWRTDLEVALAAPAAAPPPGVGATEARWAAALRASLEAVEASLVADVMAHRLAGGCSWRLLNHVDRSTYSGV